MSTPTRSVLIGQWFDSDVPSKRNRSLRLWQLPNGETELVAAARGEWADVWPAEVVLTRGVSRADAARIAAALGLDPYLIRGGRLSDRPTRELDHSVRVAS